MKKSTLYIDLEDDIAGIADKIATNDAKLLALVLPKRPTLLQSSVNVRLLKKAADDASKNIVLVTNDEQVRRLSGMSGIHVATTLQSKPEIPAVAQDSENVVEEISDGGGVADPVQPDVYANDKKVDLATPIGELTGDGTEEIDLDNNDMPAEEKPIKEKKKRIAVPNFGSFRTKLIVGVFALILISGGLYWALVIAPKASVVLTTEKSDSNVKTTVTAVLSQATVDKEKALIPAVKKDDVQKLTSSFKATGQKDVGEKAEGTMTIRNCDYPDGFTLPAGTRFTNSGKTFISLTSVVVPKFTGSASSCSLSSDKSGKATVDVVAEQSGDSYNLSSRSYSVGSISSSEEVDAVGSSMGGGTTKIATIVSQEDVDNAKTKALEKAAGDVKAKIVKLLQDENILPVQDSYATAQGEPVTSVKVGEETTSDVSLSLDVTSTMYGVRLTDIDPFITAEVEKVINISAQKIYDTGSSRATVTIAERPNADTLKLNIGASSSVGPSIDQQALASEIAGKKAGEAKQTLESRPGVTKADIVLSPFWVFSLPKNSNKITITVNE